MKTPNIAFDLDNTLFDIEPTIECLMAEDGLVYCRTNHFKIETQPVVSHNKVWGYIKEAYHHLDSLTPLPGVIELLTKIWEKTQTPCKIITARPIEAASITYELTQKHFKFPHQLILVDGWQLKLAYLRNVCYFVDDRRRTALQLANNDKIVFVPKRRYNAVENLPNNMVYINDVIDLIPLIDEFIY